MLLLCFGDPDTLDKTKINIGEEIRFEWADIVYDMSKAILDT